MTFPKLSVSFCLSLALSVIASGQSLVITHGGLYKGNFESSDPDTAAVTINTSEPVTLSQCVVTGRGDLIAAYAPGANLQVSDCVITAENPNIPGRQKGCGIFIRNPAEVHILNNRIEGAYYGICIVNGENSLPTSAPIFVWGNQILNIDGRPSNGDGGYLSTMDADGTDDNGGSHGIVFLGVHEDPNVTVAWNELINEPGKSASSDPINIYGSSGTSWNPMLITHNYVQGQFPENPNAPRQNGNAIITDDPTPVASEAPQWVEIVQNQVVGCVGGIALYAGLHITAWNNRVVSSDLQPNGQYYPTGSVGILIFDPTPGTGYAQMNFAHDNVIGTIDGLTGARNDVGFAAPYLTSQSYNEQSLHDGVITESDEQNEYQIWLQNVRAAGEFIGPR